MSPLACLPSIYCGERASVVCSILYACRCVCLCFGLELCGNMRTIPMRAIMGLRDVTRGPGENNENTVPGFDLY